VVVVLLLALLGQDAAQLAQAAGAQGVPTARSEVVMQAACTPRPPVRVSVASSSETLLNVTITAGQGALSAVRLGRVTGATVEVPGRAPITTGNVSLPLAPGATTTGFAVRRQGPGVAGTVEMVVVDGCGEWSTFVGGGTGHWTPGPSIAGLAPTSGPNAGGTRVTISGGGFSTLAGATTIKFGQAAATNVACSSTTTCAATSPAGSGTVDVTVTVDGRTSQPSSAGRFSYTGSQAAPTVTQLQPTVGPANGGTTVTITGTDFATAAGATTIRFGQAGATNVSCSSTTTCTATSPAGVGVTDVTVTVDGRTSAASTASKFTFVAVISSISPTSGPVSGGTSFTVTGHGFSTEPGRTIIMFGPLVQAARDVVCTSTTTCAGKTPPWSSDETVEIHALVGSMTTLPPNPAVRFTFGTPAVGGPRPAVSGVSPSFGSRNGGTRVTVTGTGFSTSAGGTQIGFDGVLGSDTTCSSATSCQTTTPAGLDVVNVQAFVNSAESLPTAAARFNYGSSAPTAPTSVSGTPIVTGVSPGSGPAAGGTVVTLTGSDFSATAGETTVQFGTTGVPASCADNRTCFAVAPAGSGVVEVRVTVQGRQSSSSGRFEYITGGAAPSVSAASPSSGSASGGQTVTLTGSGFSIAPDAMQFFFGDRAGTSVRCESATSCSVVSPQAPNPSATQPQTVTIRPVLAGTSGSASTSFTYDPPPTVTALSRTSGAADGNTQVTLTGTGFRTGANATKVWFGPNQATSVSCSSTTNCVATSPAGHDIVDVVAEVGGALSAVSAATKFTYPTSVTTPPWIKVSPTTATVAHIDASTKLHVEWGGLVTTGRDSVKLFPVHVANLSTDYDSLQINPTESTGTRDFPLPLVPGRYEVRLVRDHRPPESPGKVIATSKPIDIIIPLPLTPQAPAALGTVTVSWKAGPPSGYVYQNIDRDWLGLYEVGAPDAAWTTRWGNLMPFATPAEIKVALPGRAARYEFRMYQNNTGTSGGQTLIGRSAPFDLAAPAGSWTACGAGTEPGVYIYSGSGYSGTCARMVTHASTLTGTPVGDNAVSSIRIVGKWSASLSRDTNFGGPAWNFNADNVNFADFGFDNQTSSIRVFPSNCGDATAEGVYMYSEPNYGGACTRLDADTPNFDGFAASHDVASSLKMVGAGWQATLYRDPNYGGTSRLFTSDTADFGAPAEHDWASSARITRILTPSGGGTTGYRLLNTTSNCPAGHQEYGVYLFSQKKYAGDCLYLSASEADLRTTNIHVGGKTAQSIKVVYPVDHPLMYTATLYAAPDYFGTSASFVGDVRDISRTLLGDNAPLSIKIHARRQWDSPANFEATTNGFDQFDVGIYWFRCGECRYGMFPTGTPEDLTKDEDERRYFAKPDGAKAEPGQVDEYFNPAFSTLIYAHGNRPGSGAWQRETMASLDRSMPNYRGVDYTVGWKGDGPSGEMWNLGIFYWNQLADDLQFGFRTPDVFGPQAHWCVMLMILCIGETTGQVGIPMINEAKIWTTHEDYAKGMRWRRSNAAGTASGEFVQPGKDGAPPLPMSVGDLFFTHYITIMEQVQLQNQAKPAEIRFVGHSLGGQLVLKTAHWLKVRIHDGVAGHPALGSAWEWMLPKRVALVDPYFSDSTLGEEGGREFLPGKQVYVCKSWWFFDCQWETVHSGTGREGARLMREMKEKGVVFEYYHFTDYVAPRHREVADEAIYSRVRVDFVKTMPVPSDGDENGRQFGWAHMEAPVWYMYSKRFSAPAEYVWSFPGNWNATGQRAPSASMSTADLKSRATACSGRPCYWWDHIGPNQNRAPSDDQFQRVNR
jgi:hypothetical protein